MSSQGGDTARRLAAITDVADFERIASAVLRLARPAVYGNISHPGTQPGGKAVPAPFDNVGWVNTPEGSTFVCAAHSTTEQKGLKGKWLHDPTTVVPRSASGRATQPAGDLVKGIEEISSLRTAHPELTHVVFALTTNRETPFDVRAAAEVLAHRNGIELDVWSASRIGDFLDLTAEGQVIRHRHFGDPVRLLSQTLLASIGPKTLSDHVRMPSADELVTRAGLFGTPADILLVGDSGMGKTTAAAAFLRSYLQEGRCALVLGTASVQAAATLEEAVDKELRRHLPNLEGSSGAKAMELVSQAAPLLVLVEDLERSESPSRLLNKLVFWMLKEPSDRRPWRLLVPLWRRSLAAIETWDAVNKAVRIVDIGLYTPGEAASAIERRFQAAAKVIQRERAEQIASDLGADPLLIALLDVDAPSQGAKVIENYLDSKCAAAALGQGEPASEVKEAVDALVLRMSEHRSLSPKWSEVRSWPELQKYIPSLKPVLTQGDVLRWGVSQEGEALEFRHDRVRDFLVSRALATIVPFSVSGSTVLGDPFFARMAGAAAVRARVSKEALDALTATSPLVPFYALQASTVGRDSYADTASQACATWLGSQLGQAHTHFTHRLMAAEVLSSFRSPHVPALVALFPKNEQHRHSLLAARFRNGHVGAGAALLAHYELGVGVRGKEELLADVKTTYGQALVTSLDGLLKSSELHRAVRAGALRLAGYLGDAQLSQGVRHCWAADPDRDENLRDHLFAAARCCGRDTQETLKPVVDAWEALSDEADNSGRSDVNDLAADYVAWEFTRYAPLDALEYFFERARQSEKLRWPITYMLRSVDAPVVVEQLARFAAEHDFIASHFLFSDWERHARESTRQMSAASKARLWELANEEGNSEQLRRRAARLWDSTIAAGDLELARRVEPSSPIFKDAVMARAKRSDYTAVPYLVQFIVENPRYWLQVSRYFWSPELTAALGQVVERLAQSSREDDSDGEAAAAYAMRRLTPEEAYALLAPHWATLGARPRFVQEALYFAEPKLTELVSQAVRASDEPKKLFEYFALHVTMNTGQKFGFTRIEQVLAAQPYLDLLAPFDIFRLWEVCTQQGWLEFRRAHLDERVRGLPDYAKHLAGDSIDTKELDRSLAGTLFPLSIWLETQGRRGVTRAEALAGLLAWLEQNPGAKASGLVADVLMSEATRAELEPFEAIAQTRDDFAQMLLPVRFQVQSRSLV